MSIHRIPAPTASLTMVVAGADLVRNVGVDLVGDPVEGVARVLVVLPDSPFVFRLEFTRQQLADLMDELVDLADVADQQAQQLGQGALQLASADPVVPCHGC